MRKSNSGQTTTLVTLAGRCRTLSTSGVSSASTPVSLYARSSLALHFAPLADFFRDFDLAEPSTPRRTRQAAGAAAVSIELTFCLPDRPNTDFPKKGIVFLDIFPLLRDPIAFEVSRSPRRQRRPT
mgnify:CR=1 FL=1|jgi:hypothetical protein